MKGWPRTVALLGLVVLGLVLGAHFLKQGGLGPAAPGHAAPAFSGRRGVNLEGWLDGPQFSGLTGAQLAQLPRIRAAGFDFVRLLLNPQSLLASHGKEPARSVQRVLTAAREAGLKVLVSFYDDNAADKEAALQDGQAQETYLALLERTARLLSVSGARWVAFEPVTEAPECATSPTAWMQLQAKFVRAVRQGAPDLTVLVSGPCYSDYDSLTALRPLNDPNVVYGFLYVEPLLFTQQGNPENPDWAMFRDVPYPFSVAQLSPVLRSVLSAVPAPERRAQVRQAFTDLAQADFSRATLQRQIARAGDWARQNAVTVFLSAFAVRNSAPREDRARWFRDVRQSAEHAGLPWAVWSWTSPFGFEVSENGALQPELRASLGLP